MALKVPSLMSCLMPEAGGGGVGVYGGPHNPWLDHFHRMGANYLKLVSLTTAMQRDRLHVYRDIGKTYGEPKIVQRIQEYLEKVADANVSLMEKLARDYVKPEFGLNFTTINGHKVEVTEEIVEEKPFCKLIHFVRDAQRQDPKILLLSLIHIFQVGVLVVQHLGDRRGKRRLSMVNVTNGADAVSYTHLRPPEVLPSPPPCG